MKIRVTSAAGFIGIQTAKALLDRGDQLMDYGSTRTSSRHAAVMV